MTPKKLPSPYDQPEHDYALRREPHLHQLARYVRNVADAYGAAADGAEPQTRTDEIVTDKDRIRQVLTDLSTAAAHAEIARRLAIEFALENDLLSQREVAAAIGTSKKAVYDRRHDPVKVSEVAALPKLK